MDRIEPFTAEHESPEGQQKTREEALVHLENVVGKYAPHLEPAETAQILLNSFDRTNPDHLAIVNDIDIGMEDMVNARVGSSTYAPGITASEAQAQLDSTGKNFYQLGPSDTIVYGYLADNNFLNTVLNRPLVNVDQFKMGQTHAVDNEGNTVFNPPLDRQNPQLPFANYARSQYVNNPGVFSTATTTLFPQHGFITQNGTGGTVAGQTLEELARWERSAFQNIRAHKPDIEPGAINDFKKWATNAGDGWKKSGQAANAMKAFNRPSPMMPEGLSPEARRAYAGDPAQGQQGVQQWLLKTADEPTFREYATSQGRTQDITPNNEFFQENKLFWYDPATAAISAVTGGLGAAGKLAVGAGVRAAAGAAARGAAAGLTEEITEPTNLVIGATYPFDHLAKGTANTPMTVPQENGTYEQRENQTTGALNELEKLTRRVQQERNR